jgi:hypothetical protein
MKIRGLVASAVFVAAFPAGSALAKVPYFAAKCPTDISVETDRSGRAYLNGKRATVRSKNANYSEIVGGGVTISVARDPGGLIVSYTGPRRANGVCEVVEQEKVESAAPEQAAPAGPARLMEALPAKDRQACLRAVKKTTHNAKMVILETKASEANTTVIVGVGPDKAPWRCLVKRGVVAEVMSQTNEGGL